MVTAKTQQTINNATIQPNKIFAVASKNLNFSSIVMIGYLNRPLINY